jgi:YHS domain-containing protein
VIRRLLLLLAALVAGWLWLRRFRGPRKQKNRATAGPRQVEGPMVRDRVCNTFLPRSRALVLVRDGADRYFCSEECRDKYLAGVD